MSHFRMRLGSLLLFAAGAHILGHLAQSWLPSYFVSLLTFMAINSILAVSWNLVSGFTGQFSLGHAGFMAVGAYTSALLMMKAHWSFLPALLTGGAAAAACGFLVGFPCLRLVGDYLAVVTLGFHYIILAVINNTPNLTGGGLGIVGVPLRTDLAVALLALVVTVWLVGNFVYSRHGRCCRAVKEDEIAAQCLGINTTYYKLAAFTISSFFAGVGGALTGHFTMYLHPDVFNYLKTVESVTMVILGGLGSLTGSLLGACAITALPEVFRNAGTLLHSLGYAAASQWVRSAWMVMYSLLLVLMMLLRPRGLLGGWEMSWQWAVARLAKRLRAREQGGKGLGSSP
ncbi:MAG: branched-chain amino acid ABC transporter permease [Bacillota bacterium]